MSLEDKNDNENYIEVLTKQIISDQLELSKINRQTQLEELKIFLEETIEKKLKEYIGEATPVYFTREEAAKYINVSLVTLDKFLKLGIIRSSRLGKNIRILKKDLDNSLKDLKSLKYKY